jgi:hypothetical protein
MAKQAKIPQTDWTRGGRDISNTAIPLYQENLTRMGDYLSNPQARMDDYLTKYYGSNAIQNQDFLRNYNRQISQQMGNNFAATGGGYTSSGERALMDRQRALNDLAARLNQYGVTSSYNMANQDFQNMRGANADYNAAYALGHPYSQYEQYNSLVDQANDNWWSGAMSAAGSVLSAIPTPYTMAAGAALQGAGALTSVDTSGAMQAVMNPQNYSSANQATWGNTYTNLLNNLNKQGVTPAFQNWLGNAINSAAANRTNRKVAAQNAQTGLNLRGVPTP